MHAESASAGHARTQRRWLTRLVGYSFLSLPFVLLLTAIGINHVTRYGFPSFLVRQTPDPTWRVADLVSAVADRRLENRHRYRASQILGHRAPQDVVPLVLPLLESADSMTRTLALVTLGKLERGALSALPQV